MVMGKIDLILYVYLIERYIGNHINRKYSNNLNLSFENEIYVIELGEIIITKN